MIARAEQHRAARSRLCGLAYRLTGSWADAEDTADEAFARLAERDDEAPDNPDAWLTTVATRIAIDKLRRRSRESYWGTWLPEPVDTARLPDDHVALRDDLRIGLLHAYELLTPSERAAFVLREAYEMPHAEIATILDATPAAVRQWVSRSRRKVAGEAGGSSRNDDAALDRLLTAVLSGELEQVVAALTDDIRVVSDGGGKVSAGLRDIVGVRKAAYFLLKTGSTEGMEIVETEVNGAPALATRIGEAVRVVQALPGTGGIRRVYVLANPDKLRAVTLPAGWLV